MTDLTRYSLSHELSEWEVYKESPRLVKKKIIFNGLKKAGEERKQRTKVDELPVPTFLRADEANIRSRSLTSAGYL